MHVVAIQFYVTIKLHVGKILRYGFLHHFTHRIKFDAAVMLRGCMYVYMENCCLKCPSIFLCVLCIDVPCIIHSPTLFPWPYNLSHYFIHRWERKIRSTLNPSWRRWDLLVSSLYLSLSNCSSISVWHCWGHVADTAVLTILVSCICLPCLRSDSLCDTCFHSPAFLTRLQCYHFTSIRNWLQLSLWNVHDRSAWHWHKIFHVAAPCNRVMGEVCYAACYCYL